MLVIKIVYINNDVTLDEGYCTYAARCIRIYNIIRQ